MASIGSRSSADESFPSNLILMQISGLIRKLWSVETDAYRDHLLRLDAESRRNRFNATIADDTVRGYAATARGCDAILHGFFADGILRGVADLRIFGREAEAAFSVEKRWQRRGVGSALLERSLLAATNRGAKLLQVCCLMDNYRMQQLARKFGAELIFDCGTVIGTMENPQPTPLSLMQEMVADRHSFVAALGRPPAQPPTADVPAGGWSGPPSPEGRAWVR